MTMIVTDGKETASGITGKKTHGHKKKGRISFANFLKPANLNQEKIADPRGQAAKIPGKSLDLKLTNIEIQPAHSKGRKKLIATTLTEKTILPTVVKEKLTHKQGSEVGLLIAVPGAMPKSNKVAEPKQGLQALLANKSTQEKQAWTDFKILTKAPKSAGKTSALNDTPGLSVKLSEGKTTSVTVAQVKNAIGITDPKGAKSFVKGAPGSQEKKPSVDHPGPETDLIAWLRRQMGQTKSEQHTTPLVVVNKEKPQVFPSVPDTAKETNILLTPSKSSTAKTLTTQKPQKIGPQTKGSSSPRLAEASQAKLAPLKGMTVEVDKAMITNPSKKPGRTAIVSSHLTEHARGRLESPVHQKLNGEQLVKSLLNEITKPETITKAKNTTEPGKSKKKTVGVSESKIKIPARETTKLAAESRPEKAMQEKGQILEFEQAGEQQQRVQEPTLRTRPKAAPSFSAPDEKSFEPAAQQMTSVSKTEAVRSEAKPATVFHQVRDGLEQAYLLRPKSVTIRMMPEELGEMKVRVSVEKEKLHAQIHTDSHKVASLIRDQQGELEQRMRDQGIDFERIEVKEEKNDHRQSEERQRQGQSAGQFGEQNPGNGPGGKHQKGSMTEQTGEQSTPLVTQATTLPGEDSGLNLTV